MTDRKLASCRLAPAAVAAVLAPTGLVVGSSPLAAQLPPDGPLGTLHTDSRLIAAGDVFLAYRGVHADGHSHLAGAVAGGAALLIGEDAAALAAFASTPWLQVRDARAAWSFLAAAAFGNPQEHLTFIGVTGTNGKTSTVWMTAALLRGAGFGCLSLGTLGAYFGDDYWPLNHTTPDPPILFALLAHAVALRLPYVVMEVSSHAIAQGKVAPLQFAATAFTSFSRDHLDFHRTLAEYWDTKFQLFTRYCQPSARQVFAASLPQAIALNALRGECWVYGFAASAKVADWPGAQNAATLDLLVQDMSTAGTTLQLRVGERVSTGTVPYFAAHAIENFAAAVLLADKVAGAGWDSRLWAALAPVPGRLESVHSDTVGPTVLVDYAHTPDALAKTLAVLRPMCEGQLVVVFGCGGDRDRGKRPLMGQLAEELADAVLVTSDNPRGEDPAQIIQDVLAGCNHPEAIGREVDREAAIARALLAAAPRDIVLIAGKGHETYQIFATQTVPFDDRLVAQRYLRKRRDPPSLSANGG